MSRPANHRVGRTNRVSTVLQALILAAALAHPAAQGGEVYSQPPTDMQLWQSSSGSYDWQATDYDTYLWDNFTLAADADVAALTWHGTYQYGGVTPYADNPVKDFVVSIYPSKILGPSYSEPDLQFDAKGNPHPMFSTRVRSNAAESPPCALPCYNDWHAYRAALPTPFKATAGTEYWLLIEGIQTGVADWCISRGGGGDGRSFATQGYRFVGLGNDAGFTLLTATGFENESSRLQYQGWKGLRNAAADGGSWRYSVTKNDSLGFVFSGRTIDWVTRTGPDMGIAKVRIDGVAMPDVDLYSPAPAFGAVQSYAGLAAATHTIKISVSGTHNASATANKVALDAFVVGTTRTQDDSLKIAWGSWSGKTVAGASGGNYRSAATTGASVSFTFKGTQVDWLSAGGPAFGMAEVFIDGASQGVVDLYRPTAQWRLPVSYSGLGTGSHTIRVRVLGQKNAASSGKAVVVDAFRVF